MKILNILKSVLDIVLVKFLAFILLSLLACVCWQVFSRYALQFPATFTEELVRFLLIWVGLLGAAYGFGVKAHLSLTLLINKMNLNLRKICSIFIILLIITFASTVLVYGGVKIMSVASDQLSSVLRVPMNIVYSVLPLSGILIIFYQIYYLCIEFSSIELRTK